MSQHDFDITTADANTGAAYRAAVNAALQALSSCNSGATAPVTTYPYQLWADTTAKMMKQRSMFNNRWVPLWNLDSAISRATINHLQSPYDIPASMLLLVINCTTESVIANMPPASSIAANQRILIKRLDSNSSLTVTLKAYAPDGVFDDGTTELLVPVKTVLDLTRSHLSNGWMIISKYVVV